MAGILFTSAWSDVWETSLRESFLSLACDVLLFTWKKKKVTAAWGRSAKATHDNRAGVLTRRNKITFPFFSAIYFISFQGCVRGFLTGLIHILGLIFLCRSGERGTKRQPSSEAQPRSHPRVLHFGAAFLHAPLVPRWLATWRCSYF